MYLPKPVEKVIKTLTDAGFEAYAVGGCVRDSIMGRMPGDYDVTTSALPDETASVFADWRVFATGMKHGTVTVISEGMPIEVTTFRIDGEYTDHRHPDEVTFTRSLEEDLARRDFTMNAIAYSPERGIVDPFGGTQDIKRGVIRCVGDPDRRFREDALRILRALRFASVLGFELDDETARSALENRELLRSVSAERISSELLKLLCGEKAGRTVMDHAEILGAVIPEILPLKGFDQKSPWHIYDVLEHTAHTIDAVPEKPALRLAALLHDIGKPQCFTVDDKGTGHFYGHAGISGAIAENILTRLKFDNSTKKRAVELVKQHDRQIDDNERGVSRALSRLTPEIFFELLELKRGDNAAHSPELAWRSQYYDRLEETAKKIIEQGKCFSLKDLAVNGDDLIAAGMKPGKELGEMLSYLLEAVLTGKAENDKMSLLKIMRSLGKAERDEGQEDKIHTDH